MARQKFIDDSHWFEVEQINSYAMFMGHLSMAVRGLAFMVVAWSSVVLLGGFVSMLEKDFRSLAGIALLQTTGVFDSFRKERLRNIWHVFQGLVVSTLFNKFEERESRSGSLRTFLASLPFLVAYTIVTAGKVSVQVMVFIIIFLPLATIYMFGLYISTGISLWRLIKRDYGVEDRGHGKTNLKAALDALYFLALLQGVLFSYKTLYGFGEKKMVKTVAIQYKLDDEAHNFLQDYVDDTKVGCDTNPSFATGRNLITYAVDLMESRLPSGYISGLRILDNVIGLEELKGGYNENQNLVRNRMLSDQKQLIKQLIGSASPSQVLHRVIRTLDLRSPYDLEIKEHAARMVFFFFDEIRLEQFPGGIQCITSLLNMRDQEELVLQGLRILQALAADEDNCRVMSNVRGLLSSIKAPIGSELLHCNHDIAHSLLKLVMQLTNAPGENGVGDVP
ncbi:hypothetical protein ACP70R_033506 [Stipagrostis hirtigluma subsp. patula]